MKPEIRKHYFLDQHVLMAPKFVEMPHQIEKLDVMQRMSPQVCEYCPNQSNDIRDLLTLGPKDDWYVKVMKHPNGFFAPNHEAAYGHHEVVIDTPSHFTELEQLPTSHIQKVLQAFAHRSRILQRDDKVQHISFVKHRAGQPQHSLRHSVTDIYATGFLAPHLQTKLQSQELYQQHYGSSPYAHIVEQEQKTDRAIFVNDNWFVLAPYASSVNYELWVIARPSIQRLDQVDGEALYELAAILRHALRAITKLNLPYTFRIDEFPQAPQNHLVIELIPEGNIWPNQELGEHLPVNAVLPEHAALYYRSFFVR